LRNASPTIIGNRINNNKAKDDLLRFSYGGGICCLENSCPAIRNNTIIGNEADSYGYNGHGGGICCITSSPEISENTLTSNACSVFGGGICCLDDSSPMITGNVVSENKADLAQDMLEGIGGGIYCENATAIFKATGITISGNTIAGNEARYKGGGVFITDSDSPLIERNLISENNASNYYGSMGGGPLQ